MSVQTRRKSAVEPAHSGWHILASEKDSSGMGVFATLLARLALGVVRLIAGLSKLIQKEPQGAAVAEYGLEPAALGKAGLTRFRGRGD